MKTFTIVFVAIVFTLTVVNVWCYAMAAYPARVKYWWIPFFAGPYCLWKFGRNK